MVRRKDKLLFRMDTAANIKINTTSIRNKRTMVATISNTMRAMVARI